MTIRLTLLASYLFISLASALLITLLIFAHFQDILRDEIDLKLQSQATIIMQQIDMDLFERFENLSMWSKLEVMEEIRVNDVDKRLANFIDELHLSYGGIYKQIFITDINDKIVAASPMALMKQPLHFSEPWLVVTHKQHPHWLHPLDTAQQQLLFSIAVPDQYRKDNTIGRLYAAFDWWEITRLLDTPLPFASKESPVYALLMDGSGQIIATSSLLTGKPLKFDRVLDEGVKAKAGVAAKGPIAIDYLNGEEVLVGEALATGYRTFKGLGWRVLVLQAKQSALAPIWDLWTAVLAFFALTVMLAILVSLWMSGQIAGPIVRLAQFTQDFMHGKSSFPPYAKASREITELNTQFLLMINHLEQSRRDLVRVAKLAVIGEMAASMAHEVRTPLGILRSSAQILEREPSLSDIGREMTGFITSETKRLNDLITTLLACARPRPPQFATYHLHEIINHTLDMLQSQADTRRVQIRTQLAADPDELACDRDHLIQVLLNLVINAIQHVEIGGQVEVTTGNHMGTLEICINDNGAGIADTDKSKVFEPFFTQRQDGIGLGLTVVQQVVQAHQGLVYAADSPLGGASFHVILPITQKDA